MSDIFKHEPKPREPFTLAKTRKALDWALSCIIRLPIAVVSLSVILAAVAVGVLIISPETFEKACEIIGVVL